MARDIAFWLFLRYILQLLATSSNLNTLSSLDPAEELRTKGDGATEQSEERGIHQDRSDDAAVTVVVSTLET